MYKRQLPFALEKGLDLSSLFVLASTASVFSASIKDTILEYLPNLFLIDAVGSSETGATGVNIHTKDGKLKDSGGGPKFTKPSFSEILNLETLQVIQPSDTETIGYLARKGHVPVAYYKDKEKIYDAEVLESSSLDENIIVKILIRAGRTIAKPALEVLEMALDPFTPTQVRVSLMAALAYLIMPFDLFPDFMPLVGYSDDFVALTAVLSIWSRYMTPAIRARAERKLNKLFPFIK